MRYLKDQASKARRVKPKHIDMIRAALAAYLIDLATTNPGLRRRVRLVDAALPASAPYELRLYATEWEIVSKALRPVGSNPPPGSTHASWFALYTLLRKTFVFETEGSRARARALSSSRAHSK